MATKYAYFMVKQTAYNIISQCMELQAVKFLSILWREACLSEEAAIAKERDKSSTRGTDYHLCRRS